MCRQSQLLMRKCTRSGAMSCWRAIPIGLLLLQWLVACGGSSPATPQVAQALDCGPKVKASPAIAFAAADGTQYRGVLFGQGSNAVVLGHQSDQTLCDELQLARRLAAQGFVVLAANLRTPGADGLNQYKHWDRAVAAGVTALRSRHVSHVSLLGASLGGCAALVAATETTPPPDAVVSLSGEPRVADLDCDTAAQTYSGPLLIVASATDHYLNAEAANSLIAESPSKNKQLILLSGSVHGAALLGEADVWLQIVGFLNRFGT